MLVAVDPFVELEPRERGEDPGHQLRLGDDVVGPHHAVVVHDGVGRIGIDGDAAERHTHRRRDRLEPEPLQVLDELDAPLVACAPVVGSSEQEAQPIGLLH